MTGQLRTTLSARAHDLEAWEADLDAIVRDGDRRVRRRRMAIAGGLAGVLAVVGGVSALAARGHANRPQPADENAKPLTYAIGSVIHDGDSQVDVGISVDSFVRITDAFVFTHAQHVYEAKGGDVHEIGELASTTTPLVAAEADRHVGWWKGPSISIWPGYPEAEGPNGIYPETPGGWPGDSPPRVQATWGNFLWVTDGATSQVFYHDPPNGPYMSWDIRTTGPSMIQDAAAGRLLVRVGDGMAVVDANLPHELSPVENSFDGKKDLAPDGPQVRGVGTGDLAPDARHWFTTEGGHFTVYASSDGSAQEPGHAGFEDVTPYQWLSGDTVAALAHASGAPDGPVSILTCRVSTNVCTAALADVPADVVIPDGPTTASH